MTKVPRRHARTVDAEAGEASFDASELLASLPHQPGVYSLSLIHI